MEGPPRRVLRKRKLNESLPRIPYEPVSFSDDWDPPITEGFDFFTALSHYYDITLIISRYLNERDLYAVASVSPKWSHLEREIKKRNQPGWLMMFKSHYSGIAFKGSENVNYINRKFGICYYDQNCFKPEELINTPTQCKTYLNYLIEDVMHGDLSKVLCIGGYLPPNNLYVGAKSSTESPDMGSPYHTILFLPEIKDVRIKQFVYNLESTSDEIEQLLESYQLNCLLVYSVGNPEKTLNRFFRHLAIFQRKLQITVGGGTVLNVQNNFYPNVIFKNSDIFCIGFFLREEMKPEFYSASIMTDATGIEEWLDEFKQNVRFKENSIVFQFTNLNKEDKNFDEFYLRQCFPTSILHQIEVDREVGRNTFYPFDIIRGYNSNMRFLTHYTAMNTTAIVFITWGKPVPSPSNN